MGHADPEKKYRYGGEGCSGSRLAVVMHRTWVHGTDLRWSTSATAAAPVATAIAR